MNLDMILNKLGELAPEKLYGGGSLLEDVQTLGEVAINKTDCKLETSQYDRLQVVVSKDGKTAYFGVQSTKDASGNYTQKTAKKYQLLLRKVKSYGPKTKDWLEDNGINTESFAPGAMVLHARAM